jgi:hypothetical protein
MKRVFLLFILLIFALLISISNTGCTTLNPIKTTLSLNTEPSPSINYSSEKDVIYSRTYTNPETGVIEQIEFKAIASAAAYAQSERDAIQAQANASQAAALADSVRALGNMALRTTSPTPLAAPVPTPETP